MTVVVALFVAASVWAATRSGGGSASDIGDGGEDQVAVAWVQVASGELPGAMTWTLEARRDGEVCTILRTSPGPRAREQCHRRQSGRPINNATTRALRGPSGTTFVTLVQVSDAVERVRVSRNSAEPQEIPTLGGDTGLGVRFILTFTTENVDELYTALAGDGAVLGRFDRPRMSQT